VRDALGGGLEAAIGAPGRLPSWPARLFGRGGVKTPGPDSTVLVDGGWVWPNAAGWTLGNWIILRRYDPPLGDVRDKARLNHEYVHVLQYRAEGMGRFLRRYLCSWVRSICQRRTVWEVSPYEWVGVAVEALYLEHPDLPNLWELRGVVDEPPGPGRA